MPTRTIATSGRHEIVVKKSRFICSLARANNEEEARQFIAERKKEFWDASHNCSAWVIGERAELQRSNDDGEPAGTAGSPILNAINQRGLTDTVAVVTRYFGGTLLGAGGLIRAYGHATSEAIETTGIVERVPLQVVQVIALQSDAGRLEHLVRASTWPLASIEYGNEVKFFLHLPETEVGPFGNWISDVAGGRVQVESVGLKMIEIALPAR